MPKISAPAATSPVKPAPSQAKLVRPTKPYASFPLTPHASGAWQKKIKGKIHYFGKWGRRVNGVMVRLPGDGWQDALAEYEKVAGDLHAGREPHADALTVADLCNHFLTSKTRQLEAGELSGRMFTDYKGACDGVVTAFGGKRPLAELRPADFDSLRASLAKRYGPTRLGNEIQRVRTAFKYGFEAGLFETPMRFGPAFKKPSRKVMRVHRAEAGGRVFEPAELRAAIAAAGVPLRAIVLLGVNAAFGNADCGRLPLAALDLDGGWVTFHRPKTGLARRAKLWPETVEAIRAALAARPKPNDEANAGLAFITKYGGVWSAGVNNDAIKLQFGKLLAAVGVKRPGLSFYALRHTFRTVADGALDANATRLIMGHADSSIDANYTHRIDDARLVAVAEFVRGCLFPPDTSSVPQASE